MLFNDNSIYVYKIATLGFTVQEQEHYNQYLENYGSAFHLLSFNFFFLIDYIKDMVANSGYLCVINFRYLKLNT